MSCPFRRLIGLASSLNSRDAQLKKKEAAWRKRQSLDNLRKSSKSPFHMDLVAETERIDEEVQVRLQFEEQMGAAETKRKVRCAAVQSSYAELISEFTGNLPCR